MGHCGTLAEQTLVEGDVYHRWRLDQDLGIVVGWFLCTACGRPSAAYTTFHNQAAPAPGDDPASIDQWFVSNRSSSVWSPPKVQTRQYADADPKIADMASEVFTTFSFGSYRAAVLLARAVIEATAKYNEITKGDLFQKIDAMMNQHIISPTVAEAAHAIRDSGNTVAHADLSEYSVAPVDEVEANEPGEGRPPGRPSSCPGTAPRHPLGTIAG